MKRINEEIPRCLSDYETRFSEFCPDEGLDNLKKLQEETWFNFLERMKDTASIKGIDEAVIIKKITSCNAPRDYQIIFHAADTGIDSIIKRVKSWVKATEVKSRSMKKKVKATKDTGKKPFKSRRRGR